MKKLELNQMENLEGGEKGFWAGAACGGTIILAAAFTYGTVGIGGAIGANAAAFACGGLLGWGAASGTWF
ncbi:hypothetical protein [Flavobacterium sp.]|uniref:hypothetical protein n=1 Tax=Flavobacterium sp. TaxID=239 RepID=UPI004047729A